MKYRKLVSLNDQAAIIQNVKEHEAQWRVWLCIKWLSTYSDCRPSELLSLRERDIDRGQGTITIWSENTKDRRTDVVPLTPEDWEFINGLPVNFDQSAYFFRHDGARGHTEADQPFSRKMIWAAWKRACARLGIDGVDLYGGTRHSTVTGRYSAGLITAEEARKGLGDTSDAFHRYLTFDLEARRSIYARSQHAPLADNPDNGLTMGKRDTQSA